MKHSRLFFFAALATLGLGLYAAPTVPPPPPRYPPADAYVALEPMPGYGAPKERWYHVNILTIRGKAVQLEQSPVSCHGNEMSWSASDGGFFTYRGTVGGTPPKLVVTLVQAACDYCPVEIGGKPPAPRRLPLAFPAPGRAVLGNLRYIQGLSRSQITCPTR